MVSLFKKKIQKIALDFQKTRNCQIDFHCLVWKLIKMILCWVSYPEKAKICSI